MCCRFYLIHVSVCTFNFLMVYFIRYNSDGHLTNATFPTGEVSSFHNDVEKLMRVEFDTSNRENVITATNFSATSTIYTLKQGSCKYIWHCSL